MITKQGICLSTQIQQSICASEEYVPPVFSISIDVHATLDLLKKVKDVNLVWTEIDELLNLSESCISKTQ